ncbi:MAG: DUF4013 domain-containing protein [Nanoarchaeota archaeon]|nr:DUF4013 domain-containing protein [Nanoarchaeota archaeon]
MVNYIIAIKRPFSDWKKLGIGCLILLGVGIASFIMMIPFTLSTILTKNFILKYVPNIISIFVFAVPTAYFIKCGFTASKKKFSLPNWSDFGALFNDGIKLGIISLIYSIPFMLILSSVSTSILGPSLYAEFKEISAHSIMDEASPESRAKEEQVYSRLIQKLPILIPVMFLIYMVWWLIVSVALLRFMDKKNLKDSFVLSSIFRISFSPKYILAFLIMTLIGIGSIICISLVSILLAVTIIGIILLPFLFLIYAFAITVIGYTILGQAYGEVK